MDEWFVQMCPGEVEATISIGNKQLDALLDIVAPMRGWKKEA